MFLTPDAEPFVGGTYFPARDGDRPGVTGFLTLLMRIQEIWSTDPDRVKSEGKTIAQFTKAELEKRRGALTVDTRRQAAGRCAGSAGRRVRPEIRRLWLYA